MALIKYIETNISAERMAIIEQVNEIIGEYQEQGYTLTLRQVYYQLVSRDLMPNKQSEYKRLGDIISIGRRAGLIDWEAIEDRTRNLRRLASWDGPAEIVGACADQFRLDLWAGQPYRPEVWVEKDALVGVLEVACEPLRVPYFSCRGYTSDSEIWAAAQRLERWRSVRIDQRFGSNSGELFPKPVVFHLGDHDPSGIDMSRDIYDRLMLFSELGVKVERLALNMEQIRAFRPPPNPAKKTDARYKGYEETHGDQSWELDALDPTRITALIQTSVRELLDEPTWDLWKAEEDRHREQLKNVAESWDQLTIKRKPRG